MKCLTTKCLIAAAAFVVVAGSASAEVLKAEIPFSFRAGTTLMAPGTYSVYTGRHGVHTNVIRLSNPEMKSNALLMVQKQDAARAWIEARVPKLAFDCVDGRCELTKIWDGSNTEALTLRTRGRAKSDAASLTVITVNAVKAE